MAEPACRTDRRAGYARRRPELTALYRTLSTHWPRFLERANDAGGLPKFVTSELEGYLCCGRPEHGCALLVCERCGKSMQVAFSCKRRGFCPSCCGRRMMNDAALHLTERVFPEVPVRQWVCSMPFQLRYLLGYDRALCAAVLRAFAVELSRSYGHRAKREHGLASVSVLHTGSATFVQRVDSALRLNVHAHVLALDGVYLRRGSRSAPEALTWLSLSEPTAADVQELTERTAARVARVLRSHGRYLDYQDPADGAGEVDTLAQEQPALAACYQASASGRALLGVAGGKSPQRVLGPSAASTRSVSLCAQVRGVNIHASLAVPARDRARLERLCRYAARPPHPSSQHVVETHDRAELEDLGRGLEARTKAALVDGDHDSAVSVGGMEHPGHRSEFKLSSAKSPARSAPGSFGRASRPSACALLCDRTVECYATASLNDLQ